MSKQNRSTIKTHFETGDVPTQSQFSDSFDSQVFWNDDVVTDLTSNDDNHVPTVKAVVDAIVASAPTLQEVLVQGNETLGTNIKVNNADAIELENASLLKKGTYNFGGNGGISRICGVGYEDMWQSGIRHVFDNMGYIRESTNCFNIIPDASFDETLRFQVGSRWVLDDGTLYVCTDATTASAVWDLISNVPNLQEVTDAGSLTTNAITTSDHYVQNGNLQFALLASGQSVYTPNLASPSIKTEVNITTPTATRTIAFKDESGTVAFLSDITGAGVASVTGNIVDNTDPANPDASLTAANVHTFVDSLTALVTPADADKMIIVDNSASLAKKITWTNIKATLSTYFDGLYTGKNTTITGATKTKITYDSKGLVTSGADATTADIAASTDKNYVTDAQAVVIGNTSGTNSGNETTTTIGTLINGATSKTTPVDADQVALMDSAASNIIKKLSWANIKATLKTYFDTIYQAAGTYLTASNNLSDLTNTTTARTNLKILQAENAAIITNNTITATAITGLSFSAAANKIYYIYGAMRFGSGGAGGTKFSVTIPTGATIGFELIGTGSSQTNTSNANIDAGASLSLAFCTISSSAGVLHFKGTIETSSTAGTVQLNFAAGSAGQTSQINKLGTYLIAIEK